MSYDYQAPPESYFPNTTVENNQLEWAVDNDPHTVTFWNAVCAFINHEREHGENPDLVLECPSWGQWRSIGQHFAAGRKVEAINRLRASTCAWTLLQPPPPVPQGIGNEKWRAFMAANAPQAWDHHGGLTLSEAKSILDTLEHVPHWFGNDTNKVFSPLHVTCADGGHVPEEPEQPKSLGDLLREKIYAMREEPPREDPEKPEHSLWLNIYPDDPGHPVAMAHGSREDADRHASKDRIACINVKFKKGEGL